MPRVCGGVTDQVLSDQRRAESCGRQSRKDPLSTEEPSDGGGTHKPKTGKNCHGGHKESCSKPANQESNAVRTSGSMEASNRDDEDEDEDGKGNKRKSVDIIGGCQNSNSESIAAAKGKSEEGRKKEEADASQEW